MVNRVNWQDKNAIKRLGSALCAGEVAISTTDTVLGLLAATTKEGFLALNSIKGREQKPYLVLCASISQAKNLLAAPLSAQLERVIESVWPGPVTIIGRAGAHVPVHMRSPEGTIAIRVPDHAGLQELCMLTGPLFSTSANKAGGPIPESVGDIDVSLLAQVAYVVDGVVSGVGKDMVNKGVEVGSREKAPVASTILDCTTDTIKVVRQGAFTLDDLNEILDV